ncbi:MAG: hypothetical protein KatS3mg096_526 [Candidatus Parcubacteria bacterium]|nr:MAG: hypothetical protein KatS3mg096_526 [Candidatus Parcubacteria bacterium]
MNNLTYIGGGADIRTSNSFSQLKDPCENYKNKQYPNILISEIQSESASSTDDEYIELYNPNNEEIDLTCWKLEKYSSKNPDSTSTPNLYTLIPQSKFQGKIKPYSFFLISAEEFKDNYQADLTYAQSYSISKNNTIILRKPNGEISDLVGYGDNKEKIYQSEIEPFISLNFENKSIQRKNLQDTDNNSQDFWLRNPNPENSKSISRKLREDFIDLSQVKIDNFIVEITSTEESIYLNITFQEPLLNLSSTNYFYDLLISTSTNFSTFKLEDFGTSSTFPQPQFNNSTTTLFFEINKCPTTSTIYYFALFLKDKLDEENYTFSTSSTDLPQDLCNPQEPILIQNISTATPSTGKILFSEIYIKEGTSTGEYIELYNPNDFNIDLTDWRIERIKSTGSSTTIIPSSKFKGIIPAFSYFLLVNNNTSLEMTTQSDFIYAKSHNLAKNNGLILYDKDNNQIDYVCWGNITNFNDCVANPTSTSLSLQRKKTSTSSSETIINQNLGNAYSTNNPSNDFVYAPLNPENSLITKSTIKNILDFQIKTEDKNYLLSWFSPAYYDQDLIYEIKVSTSSTSTDYLLIATTTFSILSNQQFNLNICQLQLDFLPNTDIYFQLNLKNDNQTIKTISTSTKMIDCNDITSSFQQIYREPEFRPGYVSVPIGINWEYKLLNNVKVNRITIIFPPSANFQNSLLFTNLSVQLTKVPTEEIPIQEYDFSLKYVDPQYVIPILTIDFVQPLMLTKDEIIRLKIQAEEILFPYDPKFEGEILY